VTWFRVDDKYHDHPKVRKLQRDKMPATGLWLLTGSWAADNLSDGFVPAEIVRRFDPRERYARRLVEVGLWVEETRGDEPGYRFHEWTNYQPTRSEVHKHREDGRERVRRWRERNGQNSPVPDPTGPNSNGVRNALPHSACNGVTSALVTPLVTAPPTRPNPTPTQPQESKSKSRSKSLPRSACEDDRFEEFWRAYPRRVDRRDAERAWAKAVKIHAAEQIIAAAKRYTAVSANQGPKYTKYPATWLNKGCYLDEGETPELWLVNGDTARRDSKSGRIIESWG
jgi:hypothetical protein